MLFQTLTIAFASSSLVQAYGNGYDNGYGSGYGKNYVSSSQNTLSRRACYIDLDGVQHCTPPPQPEYTDDYSHTYLARRACSINEYGRRECFTPKPAVDPVSVVDPKPVVDPKNPVAVACKTGGCFIDENGKQHCDNTQRCEYDHNKY